jgi:hypothetical protein
MAGRLDLRQYVSGNNSQCSGNIDKLDNVNSSLPVLIFGDKGLWFAQRLCHVGLRHPFCLAGVREQGLEEFLSWRAQGFRHSERGPIEEKEPFR